MKRRIRVAAASSLLALGVLGLNACGGGDDDEGTVTEATITKAPDVVLAGRTANFEFTANQPDATFECALRFRPRRGGLPDPVVVKPFRPCTSPLRVRSAPGKNKLQVRATVGGVTDATPARATWRTLASG